jgi:hypothetical protein
MTILSLVWSERTCPRLLGRNVGRAYRPNGREARRSSAYRQNSANLVILAGQHPHASNDERLVLDELHALAADSALHGRVALPRTRHGLLQIVAAALATSLLPLSRSIVQRLMDGCDCHSVPKRMDQLMLLRSLVSAGKKDHRWPNPPTNSRRSPMPLS